MLVTVTRWKLNSRGSSQELEVENGWMDGGRGVRRTEDWGQHGSGAVDVVGPPTQAWSNALVLGTHTSSLAAPETSRKAPRTRPGPADRNTNRPRRGKAKIAVKKLK